MNDTYVCLDGPVFNYAESGISSIKQEEWIMGLDINTKLAKRTPTGSVRRGGRRFPYPGVPGGYLKAEILGMVQEIAEKYGNGIVTSYHPSGL